MSKYQGSWMIKTIGIMTLTLFMFGCTTFPMEGGGPQQSLGQEARAQGSAPESAQVVKLSIPFNPSLPKYAVIIEPFQYSASGQQSGGGQAAPVANEIVEGITVTSMSPDGNEIRTTINTSAGPDIGRGMAAQLRTALSGWPNISILPVEAAKKNSDGTYTCKLQPGEIGPFVITGIVTEFSETAAAARKENGVNTKDIGRVLNGIGWATGHWGTERVGDAVRWSGPEFRNSKMKRTGMVGMDLAVLDGRIARYVGGGTFNCAGSFTTVAVASDMNVLGFSSGQNMEASSSLGNATRAALNDALKKTCDALATVK